MSQNNNQEWQQKQEAKKKREKQLQDYIGVNERIDKFWSKYPDGRILTEILKWEQGVITMRASIYKNQEDETPYTVGHAYEREGDGFINKGNALENCETSAIGRALGIGGFEIKKSIASKEEVSQAKYRQENEQKSESQQSPQKPNNNDDENIKHFQMLKSKWELQAGSLAGFNEWYLQQQKKGWDNKKIYQFFMDAMANRESREG